MKRLTELLEGHAAAEAGGLPAQLQWIEDVAAAAAHPDLGDAGLAASRDLRAALGAVVVYAETPADERNPDALDAVMRDFLAAAFTSLAEGLAALYEEMAPLSREQGDELRRLAETCRRLAAGH